MNVAKISDNPVNVFHELGNQPLHEDTPYRRAVGSLAYLADTTRLDIAFAVNKLQMKLAKPTANDWKSVKQVFRYLKGNVDYGIKFNHNATNDELVGWCDADFAGDSATNRSTTGFVMTLFDAPFHWKTKLQKHVTLSSTEAEVIALCYLSKELSWIRRMLIELNVIGNRPAVIRCDNQSALKIVKSERNKGRTRHLRAQDSFVREQIDSRELTIEHVKSRDQLADLLTKLVNTKQFIVNRNQLFSTNVK